MSDSQSYIELQFCKRHWFFDYFFHTQYFYSFIKSKIYVKAILREGDSAQPFSLFVKYCQSVKSGTFRIPIDKRLSFVFKEGEKETVSIDPIECRFPIPDVYRFDIIYQNHPDYPERKSPPDIFYYPFDKILLKEEKTNFDDGEIFIVLDYHSMILIRLTWVLIFLTGILIIQGLIPSFIKLIKYFFW